jgi:outer membrane murein-binding lipoprotein Lpp
MDAGVHTHQGEATTVYATREYVDTRFVMIKEDLTSLGDSIAELQEGQQRLEIKVGTIDTKVDTIDTKVDTLTVRVDTLATKFDGMDEHLRAILRHLGVPAPEPTAAPQAE